MSNPPERPHTPGPEERLDSWKDIAAYLQRDVSTVQRWEKREGMPVHRHVHDKLGSVYAFRSDLDAWRARASHLAPAPMPAERRRTPWRLVVAAGGLIAVAAIIIVAVSLIGRPGAGSSPDASDLLLRARYLSVRTTDVDNRSAIELLERAIAIDPASARAHAELASAYVTRLAYVTPDETRELEEKAFAAAEKALTIDPEVPEAYLARGDLLWTHSQRFAHERAVQEFRRALALNPQSDQAHRRLARVFVHVGFFDEARRHADQALTINPSNAQALNSRAQSILWSGHDEDALVILLSIPGPVLPELVEANAGHRGIAARSVRLAAGPGVDCRRPAAQSGQSVASRRVLRGRGTGPHGQRRRGRPLAAGGGGDGLSVLRVVRDRSQPRSHPTRSAIPILHGGDAKDVHRVEAGAVPRRQVVNWLRRFYGSVLA
jgi:Tfp pilus assembly protein PilF